MELRAIARAYKKWVEETQEGVMFHSTFVVIYQRKNGQVHFYDFDIEILRSAFPSFVEILREVKTAMFIEKMASFFDSFGIDHWTLKRILGFIEIDDICL
jgi:hypothetical protein